MFARAFSESPSNIAAGPNCEPTGCVRPPRSLLMGYSITLTANLENVSSYR